MKETMEAHYLQSIATVNMLMSFYHWDWRVLKVVCRLALAIWSYWHGCIERIFLNISKAANPLETP